MAVPHPDLDPHSLETVTIHASAIAAGGRVALIRGPSGAGKSDLTLRCIALAPTPLLPQQASLVSYDQTVITRRGGKLYASAPARIAGLLEARGIPNPAKSNAPSARVERLADYIAAPENAPPNARALARAAKAARVEGLADYAGRTTADDLREKCVYGGARGFWTTTPAAQKMEMLALAVVSAHSKDPINHYVLSWREGERPMPAQIEEAVDIFLDAMGLADHQPIYGLHADTDNRHLHLMVTGWTR